jgi:hypothetical protein
MEDDVSEESTFYNFYSESGEDPFFRSVGKDPSDNMASHKIVMLFLLT